MLIKITDEELASRGFTLADREELFVASHPEWIGRTKELLGVYVTCQSDCSTNGHVAFEDALAHVQNCGWCRGHLNRSVTTRSDTETMPS